MRPSSGLDIAIKKIQELELRKEAKMSKPLAICDVEDDEDESVSYLNFNYIFSVLI